VSRRVERHADHIECGVWARDVKSESRFFGERVTIVRFAGFGRDVTVIIMHSPIFPHQGAISLMPRNLSGNGSLIAVVPTPMDSGGEIHREGLRHLVSWIDRSAPGGVAIGSPIGRGSKLAPDSWIRLVRTWRDGLSAEKLLVASVGATPEVRRPLEVFESARMIASQASREGADVLLVQPPGALRGRPERDRQVLEYHSALAEVGLPLLISYRRESSGGIAYGPEVLAQLLARPEVLGVEIATIDGITTFQQVQALSKELAPDKIVISGEERFLGYSLMSGADAAMVGIGTIAPELVEDLLRAYFEPDPARFLTRSAEVDNLARSIFRSPIEGATLRLLRNLVDQKIIPPEAANDPWGPMSRS
jgi:4-hydroxy-tetrahydrodipicolinate synthase